MAKPDAPENFISELTEELADSHHQDDAQADIDGHSGGATESHWVLNNRRRLGKIHHHKRCLHRSHRKH